MTAPDCPNTTPNRVKRQLSRIPGLVGLLAFLAALPGCASRGTTSAQPLHTVPHVNLNRYMGDWYVIANIPYFAEKDCVGSVESYALRPDGRIDNWFTFRKGSFDAPQKKITAMATVQNHQTNAQWRVRFFGLVTADYLVLDLDPDYRWTVVGHPSRNYGWIMARTKALPKATYQGILQRLKAHGYDPARFVKVPQIPPQEASLPRRKN
jgi:apolipoprotein D and lipocalin family protein